MDIIHEVYTEDLMRKRGFKFYCWAPDATSIILLELRRGALGISDAIGMDDIEAAASVGDLFDRKIEWMMARLAPPTEFPGLL